eukprot:GHVS01009241.1.p1 GENE.GHVS01009241.1~~GHVS01009241.1.p1  ORF type:complete len:451 (+),score=123.88 GHVS01009241.1:271-1623(+)
MYPANMQQLVGTSPANSSTPTVEPLLSIPTLYSILPSFHMNSICPPPLHFPFIFPSSLSPPPLLDSTSASFDSTCANFHSTNFSQDHYIAPPLLCSPLPEQHPLYMYQPAVCHHANSLTTTTTADACFHSPFKTSCTKAEASPGGLPPSTVSDFPIKIESPSAFPPPPSPMSSSFQCPSSLSFPPALNFPPASAPSSFSPFSPTMCCCLNSSSLSSFALLSTPSYTQPPPPPPCGTPDALNSYSTSLPYLYPKVPPPPPPIPPPPPPPPIAVVVQPAPVPPTSAVASHPLLPVRQKRPSVTLATVKELSNLNVFKSKGSTAAMLNPYRKNMLFGLGDGGRELLRACLNAVGCKGRGLQGASVPQLLEMAHDWDLWNVALRIKVERATRQLCAKHKEFVAFKSQQGQNRKHTRRDEAFDDIYRQRLLALHNNDNRNKSITASSCVHNNVPS